MLKLVFAGLMISASGAGACPNLEGTFSYPGSKSISITQEADATPITTYTVSIDDGTCAACHFDWEFQADGLLKEKSYNEGHRKEWSRITCSNNRLQVREKMELYNDQGEKIYSEMSDLDYRINVDNNLVIEKMENGEPVSKVVHPRLD